MKFPCRSVKSRTYSGFVQKGGRVALPSDLATFRLGQRVYFHIIGREIGFQVKPKRAVGGRLLSSRIRRAVRTLVMYGPRMRDSSRSDRP